MKNIFLIILLLISVSAHAGGVSSVQSAITTGTKFTATGCSVNTLLGSGTAGTYKSGTTGTCTVVVTLNGGTGITAPTGWSCFANDRTTPADTITNTASTTTTATFYGTTVSGDVIEFACIGN